ncbi:unnamed protein product [Linum trigynum]|uniref:Uncharacterized protein n=1 Tax=Linum trigynum TaxID=586398 RepID=A0AAV2E885_9ROSI
MGTAGGGWGVMGWGGGKGEAREGWVESGLESGRNGEHGRVGGGVRGGGSERERMGEGWSARRRARVGKEWPATTGLTGG